MVRGKWSSITYNKSCIRREAGLQEERSAATESVAGVAAEVAGGGQLDAHHISYAELPDPAIMILLHCYECYCYCYMP